MLQFLKKTLAEYESDTQDKIGVRAFYQFNKLKTITAPITYFDVSCCTAAQQLRTIDITEPNKAISIKSGFTDCVNLRSIIIRSSAAPVTTTSDVFSGSRLDFGLGAIYVQPELVDSYKSSNSFSNYIIAPIDQYPLSNYETISDSWETIIYNIHNGNAGTYPLGSTKSVTLGDSTYYLQLVGYDIEPLSDNQSEHAATTWSFSFGITNRKLHSTNTTLTNGYLDCECYTWLQDEKELLPDIIKNNIAKVRKATYNNGST